jgi:hypothetical protein
MIERPAASPAAARLNLRPSADHNGSMNEKPDPRPDENATPAPMEFDLDMLRPEGEPAPPSSAVERMLARALEQVREGAATVVVEGQSERQCQAELIPLFTARATAAGLAVHDAGLGRLRAGESEVVFKPLYLLGGQPPS